MYLPLRAVLVLGLVSAMAVSARALPIIADFPAASVAVADRESVRDPYATFSAILNQTAVNAIPMGKQVAAVGSAIGSFGSAIGGAVFGGGGGLGFVPRTFPVVLMAPPPSRGVYFSLSDARPQSNVVIGAVQVPDAGITLILLGCSLLGLVLVHQSRSALAPLALVKR